MSRRDPVAHRNQCRAQLPKNIVCPPGNVEGRMGVPVEQIAEQLNTKVERVRGWVQLAES